MRITHLTLMRAIYDEMIDTNINLHVPIWNYDYKIKE